MATPPPGPGVIVATVVILLLHVPPGVASLNVVFAPTQIVVAPTIGAGSGFTTNDVVVIHPVPNVYVITVVPPGLAPPVTNPVLVPIVATAVRLLLHVPPGVPSLKVVVSPAHIVVLPDIAAGKGLTVTVTVLKQPVGNI